MAKKSKFVLSVLVALGLAGGSVLLLGKQQPATPSAHDKQAERPSQIELAAADVALAEMGAFRRTLMLSGSLQAVQETTVSSEVAGKASSVNVREGDRVEKGQVLAVLDDVEARQRLNERVANWESLKAELDLAEKNRLQNESLLRQGFISQEAFDRVENSSAVKRAELKARLAQVELARKSLGDNIIRAPMAGFVSAREVQPGQQVVANARLFGIVDLSVLEFVAAVPAADIAHVKVGQVVKLKVDGYDSQPYDGRVDRINPSAQAGTRSVPVYIRVQNAGQLLRTGLFARGELLLDENPRALTIPRAAVVDERGQNKVWLVQHGRLAKRDVSLGLFDERSGKVEVLKGIQPGETVVLARLADTAQGISVKMPAGAR
ncbi:efflux RND transporter periplasmic adaptor subunit [Chitinivorax sp. PXF-14]|uniref:efflux RND transporter periplasmic adaptor subunit n=1 Tax=Chitinivorax sp. PXF-14 TaxID=3230488 RepID=UPI00346583A3